MKRNWANRRPSTVITDSETDIACFGLPFSPADFYQHTLQFFGPTQDPELRIRTQKEAARTMHAITRM